MLDINYVRENAPEVTKAAVSKQLDPQIVTQVLELDNNITTTIKGGSGGRRRRRADPARGLLPGPPRGPGLHRRLNRGDTGPLRGQRLPDQPGQFRHLGHNPNGLDLQALSASFEIGRAHV